MLRHKAKGATYFGSRHPHGPIQFRRIGSDVDLHFAIADHMHMGRLVIVCEDDDAKPVRAQDGDHVRQ